MNTTQRVRFGMLTRLLWAAALVLAPLAAQAGGVVFTNLHSFTDGNDGGGPVAGLVQGSDGSFYGTAASGGIYPGYNSNGYSGPGAVFKITADGALTSLYSFYLSGIAGPRNGLMQGSDGYFYSTTWGGGTNDLGTAFRMDTNGALTTFYSFNVYGPSALVQSTDGNFYGTSEYGNGLGDALGYGTVFKLSTNGTLTTLYAFGTVTGTNGEPIDGAGPVAGLVQGSDGSFYGTTEYGGNFRRTPIGPDPLAFSGGTVFKISTNGVLTTLYSFTGNNDGYYPQAGLVQGSDGDYYGTTSAGGPTDFGTVFKLTTNGTLTTLYAFGTVIGTNGEPLDGGGPVAGLVQGSDGNFYGTTGYGGRFGGGFGYGTVFKITTNGTLTTLYEFGSVTGTNGQPLDGFNPVAGLVQGSDGSFYGTTWAGGQNGDGTVFRLSILPAVQGMVLSDGTLSLTWTVEPGGRYQLQCKPDLGSGNWINMSNAVHAAGATLNLTDCVTNSPQRFYRLVLSP